MSLAVEDPPTQLPEAGVVRDARGRQRRRRWRAAAAALLGAGVTGALVAGLAGNSRSRPTPRAADQHRLALSGRTPSAEATCRSMLPSSHELAPGTQRRRPPRRSGGFWHTVLVERRGPNTMIVFEAAAGRDTEFCFVGRQPRSARMGGGFGAKPPTPVPAGGVSIATSGGGSTLPEEGSQQFSNIVGRVGAGVSGVSVRFADGGHVAARIANGWFLAWWPGRRPLARTDAITVRLRA